MSLQSRAKRSRMKGGESATCRPACPGTAAVHGGREGSSGTTAVGTACPERDSPRGSGTEPRGGRGTPPHPGARNSAQESPQKSLLKSSLCHSTHILPNAREKPQKTAASPPDVP